MMIDLTKPVQTRDGREVRLYNADKLDGKQLYALHGAIEFGREWEIATWTKEGKCYASNNKNDRDLINIPVKRSGWIILYRPLSTKEKWLTAMDIFDSEAKAIEALGSATGTVMPIEWEE